MSPYLEHALIDNGVALVSSGHAGRINVMTVSFFAEASHLPVLLRIAVSPDCLTHELISASGWYLTEPPIWPIYKIANRVALRVLV